jgi:hypothetical protein
MESFKETEWELNVVKSISDFSDIESQQITWSGKDPNRISSFTETLATLYDDFDFDDYILFYSNKYGDTELLKLYLAFNLQVNNFKDDGYKLEQSVNGHMKILNDPRWIEITKIASLISSFKRNL